MIDLELISRWLGDCRLSSQREQIRLTATQAKPGNDADGIDVKRLKRRSPFPRGAVIRLIITLQRQAPERLTTAAVS